MSQNMNMKQGYEDYSSNCSWKLHSQAILVLNITRLFCLIKAVKAAGVVACEGHAVLRTATASQPHVPSAHRQTKSVQGVETPGQHDFRPD